MPVRRNIGIFFFIIFLFFTISLSALDGVFIGLEEQINANTREGLAFGQGLLMGLDINHYFAIGLKAAFSYDMEAISVLEASALARLYLPLKNTLPFVQADFGAAIIFEENNSHPSFLGGFTVGLRFYPYSLFYIEPSFRVGYPFFWGGALGIGIHFDLGK